MPTCAFAGALQTQQGRVQKVSPGANVFSWQFCTRTSRSRQLNRYGWRAMGLQRWVGWGGDVECLRAESVKALLEMSVPTVSPSSET